MAIDKKKIPKGGNKKKSKLPAEALIVKTDINYLKMNPVFRFSSADSNKWTISSWNNVELKELINTFKLMERMTWQQVKNHNGLNMKSVKDISTPDHLSKDESIVEIRVCVKKRIFGFIDKNVFNLIWFDRDHSVCAEGKNNKHG